MPKEWVLNQATNRWGLNKKRSVGPVSAWIREVAPRSVEQWEQAYYQRLARFLQEQGLEMRPEAYLRHLGERLYVKISEVLRAEIEAVTVDDCVAYIHQLAIDRTFAGYRREIETVYGQLQELLGVPIQPAPDEIDRRYQVDFVIEVQGRWIGLQIKPISFEHQPDAYAWQKRLQKSHQAFRRRYGGPVFVVFSRREGRRKVIANPEVVDAIQDAIVRLQHQPPAAASPLAP